jgi:hypothetical protein
LISLDLDILLQKASRTDVEDVVPCPGCGLQLTKGDGCAAIVCVCGKSFSWATELNKVRASLASAFEEDCGAAKLTQGAVDVTAIANRAASITFHDGCGGGGRRGGGVGTIGPGKGASEPDDASSSASVGSYDPGSLVRASAWSHLHPKPISAARARLFEVEVNLSSRALFACTSSRDR